MFDSTITNISRHIDALPEDVYFFVNNINEALAVKFSGGDTVLEGVCAIFGVKNNNQRIYEKEEYIPHLSYLQEKIDKRALFGELDHPKEFDVSLQRASHIVEELRYDGGDRIYIKVKLIESTPMGKIAKALVDAGCTLSISSRAAGQVLTEGKVKLHRIYTYDLVGEPGFSEAILRKTINESFKSNFELITESFNNIRHESILNNFEDVSEKLNFDNNYKVYKINKENKPNLQLEKNSDTMNNTDIQTLKTQMDNYSTMVKEQLTTISARVDAQGRALNKIPKIQSSSLNEAFAVEISEYVNNMANEVNTLVKFVDYLADKVESNIKYSGKIAEGLNSTMKVSKNISEKLNKSIKYTEAIGVQTNYAINYGDYLSEGLNKGIKFHNYVSTLLDKNIQFADYIGEHLTGVIGYNEYLAKAIVNDRKYTSHIYEHLNKSIKFSDYIINNINTGKISKSMKTGAPKIQELVESIDSVITKINSESANSVLENKYPFLKMLNDDEKAKFYTLDTNVKTSVVEALNGAVWMNRADVISIIESVVAVSSKHIPDYVKYMPVEYKSIFENMTQAEHNSIHAKAQLQKLTNVYQIKNFWDSLDLRGTLMRIEESKILNESKIINESQGKEGYISVDRLSQINRGYSDEYLATIKNYAEMRNK